jgi:RNA recognition motif-containing protein
VSQHQPQWSSPNGSFAFLDFHTPESATRTLVNRKNHFYGGRRLNLQYASEEATKRSGGNRNLPERLGAGGGAAPNPRSTRLDGGTLWVVCWGQHHHQHPVARGGSGSRLIAFPRQDESTEDGPEHTGYSGRTYDAAQHAPEPKKDQRGKRWEATGRPRPGAGEGRSQSHEMPECIETRIHRTGTDKKPRPVQSHPGVNQRPPTFAPQLM